MIANIKKGGNVRVKDLRKALKTCDQNLEVRLVVEGKMSVPLAEVSEGTNNVYLFNDYVPNNPPLERIDCLPGT